MELRALIISSALRMHGVTVDYSSSMETVCISDDAKVQDDIFMQGEEASKFIDEMDALYDQVQTIDKDTIALHLASEYTGCLWS